MPRNVGCTLGGMARFARGAWFPWVVSIVAVASLAINSGAQHRLRQTLAPHELNNADGPPPIIWETPRLRERTFDVESAEERKLRVVVMTNDLEQPWSVAVLPDGAMLVTERSGRLRILRNGKLSSSSVAGVPPVYLSLIHI